jgi:TRAP-type C4-dicarboxylate transport system permease small subunit
MITGTIGAVLSWYGSFMASDTWSVKLAGARLPQGLLYIPLAIGGLLIVVFSIAHIFNQDIQPVHKDE